MARAFFQSLARWLSSDASDRAENDVLARAVAAAMPDADETSRRVVTAVTGLLACVAYADGVLHPREAKAIRDELDRLEGLPPAGAATIARLLESNIGEVAASGYQQWVRDIKELAEHHLRFEVLEVLVDLATADDQLSVVEVNYLRQLAAALGLTQSDYNAVQAKHRDKLATRS
jgi:uncharacterized tellurite resistance protein B-like protein